MLCLSEVCHHAKANISWLRSSRLTAVPDDGDGPCYQVDDRRTVIGVAAVASYKYAYDLVRVHGEAGGRPDGSYHGGQVQVGLAERDGLRGVAARRSTGRHRRLPGAVPGHPALKELAGSWLHGVRYNRHAGLGKITAADSLYDDLPLGALPHPQADRTTGMPDDQPTATAQLASQ